jgi:hypothetical protein
MTHITTDEGWAGLPCAFSVVEFMAQQVVMKWERQGKEREGGDWGRSERRTYRTRAPRAVGSSCLDYGGGRGTKGMEKKE